MSHIATDTPFRRSANCQVQKNLNFNFPWLRLYGTLAGQHFMKAILLCGKHFKHIFYDHQCNNARNSLQMTSSHPCCKDWLLGPWQKHCAAPCVLVLPWNGDMKTYLGQKTNSTWRNHQTRVARQHITAELVKAVPTFFLVPKLVVCFKMFTIFSFSCLAMLPCCKRNGGQKPFTWPQADVGLLSIWCLKFNAIRTIHSRPKDSRPFSIGCLHIKLGHHHGCGFFFVLVQFYNFLESSLQQMHHAMWDVSWPVIFHEEALVQHSRGMLKNQWWASETRPFVEPLVPTL